MCCSEPISAALLKLLRAVQILTYLKYAAVVIGDIMLFPCNGYFYSFGLVVGSRPRSLRICSILDCSLLFLGCWGEMISITWHSAMMSRFSMCRSDGLWFMKLKKRFVSPRLHPLISYVICEPTSASSRMKCVIGSSVSLYSMDKVSPSWSNLPLLVFNLN